MARLSGTGTRFGAELDSLVDLTSFGVAPALVMYFLEFSTVGRFGWVLCFLYVVAAAIRLARFNVAAQAKPVAGGAWFHAMMGKNDSSAFGVEALARDEVTRRTAAR